MTDLTKERAEEIVAIFARSTCPSPGGLGIHCPEHNPELKELLERPEHGEESEVSLHSLALGFLDGHHSRDNEVDWLKAAVLELSNILRWTWQKWRGMPAKQAMDALVNAALLKGDEALK